MSDWGYWDEHPETRRFLHLRAEHEADINVALTAFAGAGLLDVEQFSFPGGSGLDIWTHYDDWNDGCLLRFRSPETPERLATRHREALSQFAEWGIHDLTSRYSESDPSGPLSEHFGASGSREVGVGVLAVMTRENRPMDDALVRRATDRLGCGKPFVFDDGALFFLRGARGLSIPLRNLFLHVGGWDGGQSFYVDTGADDLWHRVNFADLVFSVAPDDAND